MEYYENAKQYFLLRYYYKFNFILFLLTLSVLLIITSIISYTLIYRIDFYERYNYTLNSKTLQDRKLLYMKNFEALEEYLISNYIKKLNMTSYIVQNYNYINNMSDPSMKSTIDLFFNNLINSAQNNINISSEIETLTKIQDDEYEVVFFTTINNNNAETYYIKYISNIIFDINYENDFYFRVKQITINQIL